VLAAIADVVIETYAIESGLARAEKIRMRSDNRADLAADIVRAYASDAADKVAAAAKLALAALTARGLDAGVTAAAQRLAAYTPVDVIAARRRIADVVIAAGKYPL
jgi:hypothetical protein